MEHQGFSIGAALSRAWQLYKTRPMLLIGLLIIMVVLSAASGVVEELLGASSSAVSLVFWVLQTVLSIGLIRVSLKLIDNKPAGFKDVFSLESYRDEGKDLAKIFIRYVGASLALLIIVGIIPAVLLGILALASGGSLLNMGWDQLLVGIIVIAVLTFLISIPFQLFGYALVDRNVGPIESLKESWRITKGHWLALLGLNIVVVALIVLGFFAAFVGLFIAVPLSWLAYAYVYRALSGTSVSSPTAQAVPGPKL